MNAGAVTLFPLHVAQARTGADSAQTTGLPRSAQPDLLIACLVGIKPLQVPAMDPFPKNAGHSNADAERSIRLSDFGQPKTTWPTER
jgi:hypothetical protein